MKPILQYQSGGSVGSLFVDYEPFQGIERATTTNATTSGKGSPDEKSSGKAGLKDLLGLLKEVNALPTDLDALAGHIGQLYNDATLFGGEVSQNDLVSIYLSSLRLIGRAASNQREYNEAKKEATANGGINEVAIDLRGHIFVQNQETGEILTVTPQEYGDLIQQGNYQALTNSNLLYLRREDPNFAFKNDILNTVQNGIGIDKVTQMIMNIKNKIGETTLQQEGYSKQTTQQIMSGVEQLKKAQETGMTIEGLYHQQLITGSQLEEAQKALTYIWNTLPSNAKTRLMVASAEMGNENVEAGAYNLIGTLIESGLKTSRAYSVDLVKDPNNSGSDSESGNSSASGVDSDAKGIEMTPSIGFVLGMGYQREIKMNPGTVYEFKLHGINGIITDNTGKPLGEYSTLNDASNGAFAGILDWNNATYGGVKIETLNKVFLKNADIVSVDLPIDVQYFNETGIIRPDIELTTKMQKLDQAIQNKKVDKNNAEQVNAFCESINLPSMYIGYDESGHPKLDTAYYAKFARVGALVDENSLQEGIDVSVYASNEASDKVRENFKQYMKTTDKNYSLDEGGLFSTHDKLYEGAVFIPIREDIIASTYGGNKYYKLPIENAISAAQRWADDQVVQTYNPGKKLGEIK